MKIILKIIPIIAIAIFSFGTLIIPSTPVKAARDCAGLTGRAYENCMSGGGYDSSAGDTNPDESSSTPTATGSSSLVDSTCNYILGLTSWNCGVDIHDEDSLKTGIWTIVANVATDITVIAAYLVLGYVIYGGYLYSFSAGDPGKVTTGKKTLIHAFTGLAIVMLANVIMNAIRFALLGAGGVLGACNIQTGAGTCVDPTTLVTGAINWFIAIAGLVSVIFIIYGGITYITSSGDPGKAKKAKDMILYSLIGLAIVALATIITAFVSNIIKDASTTSLLNETNISKEVYEIKNS